MAHPANDPESKVTENNVFDVQRVRQLVELMNEYKLAEIDLQHGKMRIQLKGQAATCVPVASVVGPSLVPLAQPVAAAPAVVTDDASMIFIKSPMVGTFYALPKPDAPSFVKVGDSIGPETTVCILEAMKVFNEIQAECSGKIVAVLVKNGEPVEFGKPLFKVDPR